MPGPWSPIAITVSESVAVHANRRAAAAVLDRVAHQVGDDSLDAAAVGADHRPVAGHIDARLPAAAADDALDQRGQVDLLDANGLDPGVQARDLHQVVGEAPQPGHVLHEQVGEARDLRRQLLAVPLQERRLVHERGQGSAELVGDVGGEPALAGLGVGEGGDLGLEGIGHVVERRRPGAELVAPGGGQAGIQQTLGQRARGRARPGHGLQCAPRQHGADQARQRDQHEPARHQDVAQLIEVGPDLGLVVEVVQLGAVRRQRLGHDQVRHPGDRPAFVCDLARVREPAQVGRNRQPPGGDAAVGADDGRKRPPRGEAGLEPADVALAAVQRRSRDQGVQPAVLQSPAGRLVQAVVPDDEVGAERQGARREPPHHHERDRQPPAQPAGADGCRGGGHTHHRGGRRQHDGDRGVTAT